MTRLQRRIKKVKQAAADQAQLRTYRTMTGGSVVRVVDGSMRKDNKEIDWIG